MSIKKQSRLRRAKKIRAKTTQPGKARLIVIRSNKHMSAQVVVAQEHQHSVITQASSMEKEQRGFEGSKIDMAKAIGKTLAARLKEKGIDSISFDRAGFKYHGRVKALADAVREGGIEF